MDTSLVSPGQLFVLEFIFAQALIFTAFGVGLDPRQAKVFGPALSPILVGLTLGLATLASSLAAPGYTGVCKYSLKLSIENVMLWLKLLTLMNSFQPSPLSGPHVRFPTPVRFDIAANLMQGSQERDAIPLHPLAGTSLSCNAEWHFLLLHAPIHQRQAAVYENDFKSSIAQGQNYYLKPLQQLLYVYCSFLRQCQLLQ